MNPNSDLKNENAMATNVESSTVCSGYAESRISEYAARFAAYSDEVLERVSRALVFVIPRVFRKSIKYFMWS